MVAILKSEASTTVSVTIPASPMEFTAAKVDLKRALTTLQRIADRKSTMMMLGNVLLRSDGDEITMSATDLNVAATVKVAGKCASWGSLAVPAKALADLVKKLPGDMVTMRSMERSGARYVVVTSGQVSSSLESHKAADFPTLPSVLNVTTWEAMPASMLSEIIGHTEHSVCQDETRFHLNGVLVEIDGEHIRTVSTDGHRLTKCERSLPSTLKLTGILPAKGATEIRKLLGGKGTGACEVGATKTHVFVRHDDVTISVRMIDAQFPPYEQVIPKGHTKLCTVERKPLIAAFERAKLIASETRGVKMALATGKLTLTCDSPSLGESTESMDADYNRPGMDESADMAIGVNPGYFLEALAEIECKHVTISLGNELDPMLVRGTDDQVERSLGRAAFLTVIMPMRI